MDWPGSRKLRGGWDPTGEVSTRNSLVLLGHQAPHHNSASLACLGFRAMGGSKLQLPGQRQAQPCRATGVE